jgi:hypothetical protein
MFGKKKLEQVSKEEMLPNYAILYFDHLFSEYEYLMNAKTISNTNDYSNLGDKLREKRNNTHSLSWNDLFSLELLISSLLPRERLLREVWRLRSRYRDVVGLSQYEAYLASKPPDLTPEVTNDNDFRADIEYLLTEIYLRYLTNPYNEKLRNIISSRVTILILAGILIVVLISVFFNKMALNSLGPATLLLVLFIGAMGGLLSMQQRYQSISRDGDPVDNISILKQGWSRLFMPAISGSIFAALLYMIIIGGLIQGDLFPKLRIPAVDTNYHSLLNAIRNSSPEGVNDYAKLVVWSFLSGFAERFVPDVISFYFI